MNLTHATVQERIQSGIALSAEVQAAVDAHLAACPECRAYAEFHRQLGERLPAAYPPARHAERTVLEKARLVQARLAQRRGRSRVFYYAFSAAGMAAVVLLFVLVLGLLPGLVPGAPAGETAPVPASVEQRAAQPAQTAAATLRDTPAQAPALKPTVAPGPFEVPPADEPAPAPTAPVSMDVEIVPALAVDGQTVYLGDGARLAAIDIRRPAEPQLLARSEELPGEVLKVIRIPGELSARVAASAGRYLAVFDPATPGRLELLTQSKLPGPVTALILEIGPHRLYAGGTLNGDPSRGFVAVLDAIQPDALNLLDTVELDAPVQSLALYGSTLYAALAGDTPGVSVLTAQDGRLGQPEAVIPGLTVRSMTATRGVLYLGSEGKILAYRLEDPQRPELAWQVERAGETPLPETLLGFELRPSRIFAAGVDSSGRPVRLVIPLEEAIQTGSVVDTASQLSVMEGLMVVAGSPGAEASFEIYSILDPRGLKRLGGYPAEKP